MSFSQAMTFRIRVRRTATKDIRDARDWYEGQRAGLGDELGNEVDETMSAIATGAMRFGRVHGEIPRALTRRFPYAVYFIVEENEVTVLRVLHQARRAELWMRSR